MVDRFISSSYINYIGSHGNDDAVIVKVHSYDNDNNCVPELKIFRNLKRSFYVSKKAIQEEHDEKREWEDINNLDKYIVHNTDLPRQVFKSLNGYYPKGRVSMRQLGSSPYLYGADISIETLVKNNLNDKFNKSNIKPKPLTRGMFDTESSMLKGNYGELIMATINHENMIYTSILKSNFFYIDENGNKKPGNIKDLEKLATESLIPDNIFVSNKAKELANKANFKLHFHIADKSIDILRWIFEKMHKNKTDFMGVWNLSFDIKLVIKTCEDAGVDPAELLCAPELDKEYKKVRFQEAFRKPSEHISRKWDWLYAPSHTQWYDSMCLYSILRIVSGFEISYSLDNILRVNKISDGKLKFKEKIINSEEMSTADWHRHMQTKHPYEYIIYNIFDVMGLQVMEWVNNDSPALHTLMNQSSLQNFSKQTRRSADTMYFECLKKNKVVATTSVGKDLNLGVIKEGGAVLSPDRTYGMGSYSISDTPNLITYVLRHVNDIDLTAIYPRCLIGLNVSRETRISSVLSIKNKTNASIQKLHSGIISLEANSVLIGKEFFNLPGYEEMNELLKKELNK